MVVYVISPKVPFKFFLCIPYKILYSHSVWLLLLELQMSLNLIDLERDKAESTKKDAGFLRREKELFGPLRNSKE